MTKLFLAAISAFSLSTMAIELKCNSDDFIKEHYEASLKVYEPELSASNVSTYGKELCELDAEAEEFSSAYLQAIGAMVMYNPKFCADMEMKPQSKDCFIKAKERFDDMRMQCEELHRLGQNPQGARIPIFNTRIATKCMIPVILVIKDFIDHPEPPLKESQPEIGGSSKGQRVQPNLHQVQRQLNQLLNR
jgi:hypothetical protein